MAGTPSQLELFDYKPDLVKLDGKRCPDEFLEGRRFAFITGIPNMLGPQHSFHKAGRSGAWITDLLPNFERVIDEVCFVKSMHTGQFNHAPAQLMPHTGNSSPGYPSAGARTTYGLRTENQNLPGYIVLVSGGKNPDAGKSAWGPGFLPSVYQGVQFLSKGDPILFLSNPAGVDRNLRRRALDAISSINRRVHEEVGDPEILTRVSQYELAFRMQVRASKAFDLRDEPEGILQAYGAQPGGASFANNCLLARRLAERGVRFIQLFDWGGDHHGTSPKDDCKRGMATKCAQIDRPVAALLGISASTTSTPPSSTSSDSTPGSSPTPSKASNNASPASPNPPASSPKSSRDRRAANRAPRRGPASTPSAHEPPTAHPTHPTPHRNRETLVFPRSRRTVRAFHDDH